MILSKCSLCLFVLGFYTSAFAGLEKSLTVALKNGKGEVVGSAGLTPLAKGVKIVLDVHGLTPGEHAVHFHEKSACVAPKFESAGSHFAPMKGKHGFDLDGGPHAGDMPNFFVAQDGTAKVELINTNVNLGNGTSSLVKNGGTSMVIHEKADDYKSQPAGDAGGRLACGEIKGG